MLKSSVVCASPEGQRVGPSPERGSGHKRQYVLINEPEKVDDAPKSNLKGLLFVTLSTTIFAFTGVLVKLLEDQGVSSGAILEIRSIVQVLVSLAMVGRVYCVTNKDKWELNMWNPAKENKLFLFMRALTYWSFIMLYWKALQFLQNGDATALTYLSPTLIPIFAYIAVGEKIRYSYPLYLVINLLGLALIVRPSFIFGTNKSQLNTIGVMFALLSCVASAMVPVLTRMSKEAHWLWVETVSSGTSAILFTPILLVLEWKLSNENALYDLTPKNLVIIAGITISGYAGLAFNTLGYQHAEAAPASMLTYTEIPLGYLLQYLVWGEISYMGLAGSGIIIATALVYVYDEYRRSRHPQPQERDPLLGKEDVWERESTENTNRYV